MTTNQEWFAWARYRVNELISYVHSVESTSTLAASKKEMEVLFGLAMELHKSDYANSQGEELILDISLLFNVGHAVKQEPGWLGIAGTGTLPNGDVWFEPSTPETLHKYGLLLTNNALARCLSGNDNAKEGAYKVACTAHEYFGRARSWPDRWVALPCLLLGATSPNEEESLDWLRYALVMLREQPKADVEMLIRQAEMLARVDNPGMFEMLRRHRKSNSQWILGVRDLYLFNDRA